ncbi:MAG: primosomal protein N' [Chloroflexi bacterium]|nr:MAG: primosomal protein N' [Chloroflexota bacterium]
MPFAEVAVNAAAPLRQTFTYRIRDGLPIEPGQAVYVPFGSRTLQGIVVERTDSASVAQTRDIADIIDVRPLLSPTHLQLARWLSEHYLAPLFDCISLMLPPGFKRRPLVMLRPLASLEELSLLKLKDLQATVLRRAIELGEIEAEQLRREVKVKGAPSAISALIKRGFLQRSYRLARPQIAPKGVRQLRLDAPETEMLARIEDLRQDGGPRALRRALVLETLVDEGVLPLPRARDLGLTPAFLRDLETEGLARVEEVYVVRDPLAGRVFPYREPPSLTEDQQRAYETIAESLAPDSLRRAPTTFLLHGITGSGKTEVYLAALDRAIALGKRVLVLVPEISLTPQTVRRFAERLPGQVAVMHSRLSLGEHFDMWHEIRDRRYAVVIGPRSALFAPQPDLALVIIDEEHEWTYKQQEGSPRYHARRSAEELCALTGAVLVLGSATPDVESRFRADDGAFRLLELPERLLPADDGSVEAGPLPEVDVVDLREELKASNRSIFSRPLAAAMHRALDAREQVILFLNRRGTASFVQCRDCGFVPECRSCAVALTYHESEDGQAYGPSGTPARLGALICHYCRRQIKPLPTRCPECQGGRIRQVGLGTQRVEEEVRRAFPEARTLRWDRDVTRGRDSHEAILARFLAHEADVLIGTQMIAKGLDMPLVTLVGVVTADTALHLPDFRATERTFQLLEQVAGRAGRGPRGGRVIIQTYTPENHAIQSVRRHDYDSMYERDIEFRRNLGYPPFGRLVRLTFAHTGAAYSQEQAAAMASRLTQERDRRGLPNLDVLGPAPAFVPRVRGRWRWNLVLRGADPVALIRDMQFPRGWTVDVDPVSLL